MKSFAALCARGYALCLSALLLVACGNDTALPESIVVAVYTDLAVGSQLTSLTASVMNGDDAAAKHTFTFDGQQAGSNFLLSFGIERGQAPEILLKLTGYRRGEDGAPLPVVEQTLKARFLLGRTGLLRTLLSRNCLDVLSCGGDSSCDPLTGTCASIPESMVELRQGEGDERSSWLPATYQVLGDPDPGEVDGGVDAGPDAEVGSDAGADSGPEEDLCKAGDEVCPEGCDYSRDSDCLSAPGAACGEAMECASGTCLNNYCCAAACSTEHVFPSCRGGDCQAGICEENYGDCNSDKTSDGCETLLTSDPLHCGACERACRYGVCQANACPSARSGSEVKDAKVWLLAGYVYGFHVLNDNPGSVASLGVLVEAANGTKVRMALFGELADSPFEIHTQSPELTVSGETVEWIVPPDERKAIAASAYFWFYITFNKDTAVYVGSAMDVYWRSTETLEFGPIAEERYLTDESDPEQPIQVPSVFFNVVPVTPSGP